MNIQNIEIEFTCEEKKIVGMVHLPDQPNPPLVIGSHGLEGSMESAKQKLLSKILPENGFAFLRFDHRGCGNSEGDFVNDTSLSKRVQDMLHAIDHVLKLNITALQIVLFGSSLGGSTCISAWARLAEKGLTPWGAILCAAPVNSLTIGQIPLNGNERRPSLPLSFFEENLLFDLSDKLPDLHNVLIFHGDQDKTVPVENAYNLYSNASDPKKLIILKDGDHQMSDSEDQKRFEIEVIDWLKKTFSRTREEVQPNL